MIGVFSIVSDNRAGMFRLQQAARPWDEDGKSSTLTEKLENGAQGGGLSSDFIRGAEAARTAMEEAKRIAGPKSMAEDRMAQVERRLKEIRQEARLAAASGDREKLASLAREAAQLARQAGRAAKEYASGIAAAAAMGVGGEDRGNGGGAGGSTLTITSESIKTSTTTVQLQQVEVSFTLTVSGDSPAASLTASTPALANQAGALASGVAAEAQTATGEDATGDAAEDAAEDAAAGQGASNPLGLPSQISFDGLPELVRDGLAASGQAIGGFSGPTGRQLLGALMSDNELKMSRYKEADEFARRVEGALGIVKSVIGEAKAANANEPDSRRRAERRKEMDELDKDVGEARDAVDDLRGSAFGSADALAPAALLGDVTGGATGGGEAASVAVPVTAVAPAPMVDITA